MKLSRFRFTDPWPVLSCKCKGGRSPCNRSRHIRRENCGRPNSYPTEQNCTVPCLSTRQALFPTGSPFCSLHLSRFLWAVCLRQREVLQHHWVWVWFLVATTAAAGSVAASIGALHPGANSIVDLTVLVYSTPSSSCYVSCSSLFERRRLLNGHSSSWIVVQWLGSQPGQDCTAWLDQQLIWTFN